MTDKKNICLLNDSFPPIIDGVANVVVNYGEILQKHGYHPVVVTPENPGKEEDEKFSFPVLRYSGIDTRDLVGYVAGKPFSPTVMRKLEDQSIDVLHTHCPIASTFLARGMRKQLDAPVILTYHTKFDIDIAKAIKGKLIQAEAIKALVENINACDEVWVVSEGAGQNLKSLGYEGEYIVMPNGVDIPRGRMPEEQYMKLTSGYEIPDDVPLFLYVGRMMWYKGIKITVDALAALRSQGVDFRMVFVGGGTDYDEIVQYVKEQKLDDQIIFTGPIYDREVLSAWYCRAHLFLFPSTFDTNGLVVREAAACGLASVLVRGSCAAENVTHRRNGYLIEENAASMAVLLTQLANQKEEMRRCGQAASEELYISWEEAVAKAEERYQIVIENYKSGKYKKHTSVADEFFDLQGNLMDLFADIHAKGMKIESKASAFFNHYFL